MLLPTAVTCLLLAVAVLEDRRPVARASIDLALQERDKNGLEIR